MQEEDFVKSSDKNINLNSKQNEAITNQANQGLTPKSHNFNKKIFLLIIFTIFLLLIFLIGSTNLFKVKVSNNSSMQNQVIRISPTATSNSKHCNFSNVSLNKNFYLDSYVVKEGDTLLKIAQDQMGSSARVDELIAINKSWFPNLAIDNPMIKVGSKLRIPPSYLPESSGYLWGFSGAIAKTGENWIVVYPDVKSFTDPSDQAGLISYKIQDTKYLGNVSLAIGECVNIIMTLDSNRYILAISPQDKNYFKNIPVNEIKTANKQGKCQYYGYLNNNFYLPIYKTKKGDSIASIAINELGNESRAEEILNLNKKRYSHLSKENSFLEIGWELWLPPKFITKSSGILIGMGGEIIEDNNDSILLDLRLTHPGYDSGNAKWENAQFLVYKNSETKYFDKETYTVGDCVYLIKDYTEKRGIITYDIAAISSQEKNYFK